MFFHWWTRRRRRRLLTAPFPELWRAVLRENVAAYARLTAAERREVDDYLLVFIPEKNWEGCQGLAITPEVQVTIAAEVALLTLGFEGEYFDNVQSILVYPEAYVAREQTPVAPWVMLEGRSPREGEAWHRGPVILSWPDVLADAQHDSDGHNLVLHEFAHQIDMLNGGHADGIPPMASVDQYQRWTKMLEREYQQLRHDCEAGHDALLGHYAAKNKAEFFAVATEVFFELPHELQHEHAEVYEMFREFYKQDPAARM
jgi:Mlc titration factor MtfA (ptsG expression regulator)